ncbi:MAG: hypothetical protein M3Q08_06680 [Pseudomonadota bacterium]|nr:hypothetical protein [Pseudomonadota bacterium]
MRVAASFLVLFLASCDTGPSPVETEVEQGSTYAAGERFACTPTRVYDGDGPIWCAEGPRVRLAGIAAREMDGTCRPGHPCPAVSAEASRDHLAALVGRPMGRSEQGHILVEGPTLTCVSNGSAGGRRVAAWCVSPTAGDLSCQMVRDDYALKWPRYWKEHRCG